MRPCFGTFGGVTRYLGVVIVACLAGCGGSSESLSTSANSDTTATSKSTVSTGSQSSQPRTAVQLDIKKPSPAPSGSAADADSEKKKACKMAAEQCGKILLMSMNEKALGCMPIRYVARLNKAQMLEGMKSASEEMEKMGWTFESATTEMPSQWVVSGQSIYALVPQKVIFRIHLGRFQTNGHLLAVSEDSGSTWRFLEADPGHLDDLKKVYPDWPSSISVPPAEKPIFLQ